MKEKILDILEKHYHGRNFIESRCADELLGLFDVVGRSEQFICRDCEKPSKEYRDKLCEPCHKWHTDS